MLIEIRRVRVGELREDQLLAAVRTLDPHVYSAEWQDRQLAELQYSWDWWNDASHSLPKLSLNTVMEAAKEFTLNLVCLPSHLKSFISSHHDLLIFMS
jgi:hypothetical protein